MIFSFYFCQKTGRGESMQLSRLENKKLVALLTLHDLLLRFLGEHKPKRRFWRTSQRSFSSDRVPFSTFCPFGGLSCWVQSLAAKVQVSSTPTVSRHAFALFAFEPVTSTKQICSPNTALNAKRRYNCQLIFQTQRNFCNFGVATFVQVTKWTE